MNRDPDLTDYRACVRSQAAAALSEAAAVLATPRPAEEERRVHREPIEPLPSAVVERVRHAEARTERKASPSAAWVRKAVADAQEAMVEAVGRAIRIERDAAGERIALLEARIATLEARLSGQPAIVEDEGTLHVVARGTP